MDHQINYNDDAKEDADLDYSMSDYKMELVKTIEKMFEILGYNNAKIITDCLKVLKTDKLEHATEDNLEKLKKTLNFRIEAMQKEKTNAK
jgi:hypothetical protein